LRFDTFWMDRRALQSLVILVISIPTAAFFVLLPQWQIEHPGDASLVLRSERHWLWQAPEHAHLDPAGIVIPILAIAIVVFALLAVLRQAEF